MVFNFHRFIHPLVYGEYPRTMQNIVGNRLPKFTKKEVEIVKGSIDFVGINQYTTYYMYDPHQSKPKVPGYQMDWNAGFACKIILHYLSIFLNIFSVNFHDWRWFFLLNIEDAKNGAPIGPRVSWKPVNSYILYKKKKSSKTMYWLIYTWNFLQANSYWLYNVPWGMYKALMYIKERYGNPTVILSENGNTWG